MPGKSQAKYIIRHDFTKDNVQIGEKYKLFMIKSAWIDKAQAYGYTEKSSVFKERLGFYSDELVK